MNVRMDFRSWDVRRARIAVAAVGAFAFLAKMILAALTRGPADVQYFEAFSRVIANSGPIRIYEQQLPVSLPVYNHPPLASWMLLGLHQLSDWGVPFNVLIRAPACVADFVTCLLVFEMVRRRTRKCDVAFLCASGTALSPVLLFTSGFHGNTDTVAVMFAFLAAYLLVDRPSPVLAGCAAAVSISIKLIPVVAVPLFFLAAWRLGGRAMLLRFGAAFTTLFLTIWGPVFETVPGPLKEKVLEYPGGSWRYWGLMRFADLAGVSENAIAFMRGDGHFLIVLFCAAVGSWLVWRRPTALSVALATTLGLLLLLSTASAAQYLTWPAAGLFVIGLWEGLSYATVVGVFSGGLYGLFHPGTWYFSGLLMVGVVGWLILAFGVASGARATITGARPGSDSVARGPAPLHGGRPAVHAQSTSAAN
jgi:hypothetical protein